MSKERSSIFLKQQMKYINKKQRTHLVRRFAIAAAMIVVFFSVDILLNQNRLVVEQSQDKEVYLVQGIESNNNLVPAASAVSEEQEAIMHDFEDIASAFEHLGYAINMPSELSYKATVTSVSVLQSFLYDKITIFLVDEHNRNIDVRCYIYYQQYEIGREIEQNTEGSSILLKNGMTAYISENYGTAWQYYAICV